MRIKSGISISVLLVCLLANITVRAQMGHVEFRTPTNDSTQVIDILNNDKYHFEQANDTSSFQTLVGHVILRQGKTLIYCDSLIMYPHDGYLECYNNVHINDNDSVDIYSDFMKYVVASRLVNFQRHCKLTDGKSILYTDNLDYDLGTKIGMYFDGGRIVNKESVLTSKNATYYEATKDIHFYENVILRDPQYDLSADSLLYNTQTQISTFITETLIVFKDSTHRTVRTRSGFYDLQNKRAQFGKRPVMTDGSQRLTGDSVRMDDSTGIATAIGNAIYMDTTQGIKLFANYMFNNKKKNTFFATQHPLMAIKQDKDSLYITADTLESKRLVDYQDEQVRLAIEDSLHRIFVDSLEKRAADSLHNLTLLRNKRDSIARANGDTTLITDISDSPAIAHGRDSVYLDSLHRARGDISVRQVFTIKDSVGKPMITTEDIRRINPPTPKQLAQEAKAKRQAERQAKKDSLDNIKELAREHKDSLRAQQKRYQDSLKIRAQDIQDSIAVEKGKERARKRATADSIRQVAINDSLKVVARNDSIRHANFIDSLDRVGLTDSANAIRRHDSLALVARTRRPPRDTAVAEGPLPGQEIDSISKLNTRDTTLRFVIGYHHVRIYSDSMQAVGDSLYYSSKDSVFRLFYNPIAWSSGTYQITGDTMYVYTKNKKPYRLYCFENALAINKVAKKLYNQLKGTTINAFFKGGEIDYIRAKGNAESIYYVADERKAYTGANKAHADIIDMRFAMKYDSLGAPKGKELDRVILRNDAEGTMYPIKHVVFEDMILRGFKWQEERRPKSKKEMFEEIKRNPDDDIDEIGDINTPPSTAPPPATANH